MKEEKQVAEPSASRRWLTSDSIELWDGKCPWPPDLRAAAARERLRTNPRVRGLRRPRRYSFASLP